MPRGNAFEVFVWVTGGVAARRCGDCRVLFSVGPAPAKSFPRLVFGDAPKPTRKTSMTKILPTVGRIDGARQTGINRLGTVGGRRPLTAEEG
jgi:hypothetical protein